MEDMRAMIIRRRIRMIRQRMTENAANEGEDTQGGQNQKMGEKGEGRREAKPGWKRWMEGKG